MEFMSSCLCPSLVFHIYIQNGRDRFLDKVPATVMLWTRVSDLRYGRVIPSVIVLLRRSSLHQ